MASRAVVGEDSESEDDVVAPSAAQAQPSAVVAGEDTESDSDQENEDAHTSQAAAQPPASSSSSSSNGAKAIVKVSQQGTATFGEDDEESEGDDEEDDGDHDHVVKSKTADTVEELTAQLSGTHEKTPSRSASSVVQGEEDEEDEEDEDDEDDDDVDQAEQEGRRTLRSRGGLSSDKAGKDIVSRRHQKLVTLNRRIRQKVVKQTQQMHESTLSCISTVSSSMSHCQTAAQDIHDLTRLLEQDLESLDDKLSTAVSGMYLPAMRT